MPRGALRVTARTRSGTAGRGFRAFRIGAQPSRRSGRTRLASTPWMTPIVSAVARSADGTHHRRRANRRVRGTFALRCLGDRAVLAQRLGPDAPAPDASRGTAGAILGRRPRSLLRARRHRRRARRARRLDLPGRRSTVVDAATCSTREARVAPIAVTRPSSRFSARRRSATCWSF